MQFAAMKRQGADRRSFEHIYVWISLTPWKHKGVLSNIDVWISLTPWKHQGVLCKNIVS